MKHFLFVCLLAACHTIDCKEGAKKTIMPAASIAFDLKDVPQLAGVEWADKTGLVKRVFKVTVPEVTYPYNPSIIPYKDGYLLAYRHDPKWFKYAVRPGVVGLLRLNKNLEAVGSSTFLSAGKGSAEDPRLFWVNDALYVSYTHVTAYSPLTCNMAVSELDPETFAVRQDANIMYGQGITQKNWIPFVTRDSDTGRDDVYFMYRYAPLEVLKLPLPFDRSVKKAYGQKHIPSLLNAWSKKWGEIRGGTPPIPFGNDFLAFFHTSFMSGRIRYYVMGALTFSGRPPFEITSISTEPLFFKGIYETPVTPDVHFYPRNDLRVIFPSGLAEGVEDDRDVYYVLCGENDVAIKCVVVDKKKLLKSLSSIK